MSDTNNKEKSTSADAEKLIIWAAVAPNGVVLKSSVGVFRAAAMRWAMKYNGFEVVKVGELRVPNVEPRQLRGRNVKPNLPPKVKEAIREAKRSTTKQTAKAS